MQFVHAIESNLTARMFAALKGIYPRLHTPGRRPPWHWRWAPTDAMEFCDCWSDAEDGYEEMPSLASSTIDDLDRIIREVKQGSMHPDAAVPGLEDKGVRLLHVAAGIGRFDFLRLLIKKGADPNAVEEVNGFTPLLCAIDMGLADAALMLLQGMPSVDVNVRAPSRGDATALMLAAERDVDGRLQRGGGGGDVPDGGGGGGLGGPRRHRRRGRLRDAAADRRGGAADGGGWWRRA